MSSPQRVAVLSRSFSSDPILRERVLARVPHVTFNDAGRSLAGNELAAFADGHDALIVALETIDAALLDRLPMLRTIGKYGVGIDNVDLPGCAARGISVGWTAGVNKRSVVELAFALMIMLMRDYPTIRRELADGGFRQVRGRQLTDATVAIIGCGHVGQDLVPLLRLLGTNVLVHDIRPLDDFCTRTGARQVGLDEALGAADIVSLHLPRTPVTRGLLSAERIAAIKPGAMLVNTARGGLVDEAAVARALDSGHLAAAAFDVFAIEPPTGSPLLDHPRVIVTPHIGGSTRECILAMGQAAIDGLFDARDPLDLVPSYLLGGAGT